MSANTECYTVVMRHIFSTNEDVEYEQHVSSSFEKGRHYSNMFLNESLLSLGYQLKIFTANERLHKPIN